MLEVVDERHHGAAVDSERDAEGLLGLALGGGEVAEHAEVSRVKAEAGEALGEAPMRVGAELRQQEAGTAAQSPRRGGLHGAWVCGHPADGIARVELFML
jgi:hypothetical protein